jgi:hypothetical protein
VQDQSPALVTRAFAWWAALLMPRIRLDSANGIEAAPCSNADANGNLIDTPFKVGSSIGKTATC